ncbi:MAG: hypothetical protein NC319_07650 [Butyricicoccus sp.]|nr:hypothetical protein [Butyricicoccus sp.]
MKKAQFTISGAGLAVAAAVFVRWWTDTPGTSAAGRACALLSACLMVLLCLRFVPVWLRFWARDGGPPENAPWDGDERGICAKIFLALLLADAALLLCVLLMRRMMGYGESFARSLEFWTCADSRHYLDIARDWYLSEGEWDRLVQLVFLPGYPVAVRVMAILVGNYLYAGLLVSALAFAGAGCVLYLLLRLDFDRAGALRGLKYICLVPGSFFFAAPMSDGLFLLLSLLCVYFARRRQWLFSCLLGAMAAFTRSLGLALFLPVLFELVHETARSGALTPRRAARFALLLLIPAGFGGYCLINYLVAGDPFKYMEYQSVHWGQRFGFFFNTAAYQLDNAVSSFHKDIHVFLGLWLPNLLCSFGALVVMLTGVRRLRASYTAYFIGYFFVAIGATWLLSAPRYLASLFPVTVSMAYLGGDRRADLALTLTLAGCWALYLCAFVLRWQVW